MVRAPTGRRRRFLGKKTHETEMHPPYGPGTGTWLSGEDKITAKVLHPKPSARLYLVSEASLNVRRPFSIGERKEDSDE